ncbi:MAG: SWIM zinc finger family protein [Alphaproteobacteria bacterium]
MAHWYYDYDDFYKPSRPLAAKGGIRAQSKRGRFGESWWAGRWIETLESFDIGARLHRGRSYARRGQVLSIAIEKGAVSAVVQGSRPRPYRVEIKIKRLSVAAWKKLAKALASQAIYSAKLLAGEMPENIEDAFKKAGLTLFPNKRRDLQTDCSCPDWSNPCKHIAAVYYLLGEEFDRDPFLIFRLRGMERGELTGLVGGKAPARTEATAKTATAEKTAPPPESLPTDPETFWGQPLQQGDAGYDVSIPATPAALPKRLGNFPFWRGQDAFLPALEAIYRQASPVGLSVFLGESK